MAPFSSVRDEADSNVQTLTPAAGTSSVRDTDTLWLHCTVITSGLIEGVQINVDSCKSNRLLIGPMSRAVLVTKHCPFETIRFKSSVTCPKEGNTITNDTRPTSNDRRKQVIWQLSMFDHETRQLAYRPRSAIRTGNGSPSA